MKKKIKKLLAMVIALTMCASMFSGCGKGNNKQNADDQNTLTITVMPNRIDEVLVAMQEKFPDINFEFNYYVGDNTSSFLGEQIRNGDAGDLIFYTTFTNMEEDTSQLLDLSGYPLAGNISEDILQFLDVNGSIYQIPGPLELRCIIYNKTLFEENGWEVPTNFDEQIEVIKEIRETQPDIIPMVYPTIAAYSFVLPATYSQAGFLSSPAGYQWEQDFFSAESSFGEGLAEGFTVVEELVEAEAFCSDTANLEQFVGKWNCNDSLINREAAMYISWGGISSFFELVESGETTDEYGLLPFYGIDEGTSVIGYNASSLWSVNKRLGEEGNEKKLENALKVMEWLVSIEGQELLRGNRGQIPVTKDGITMEPYVEELMELGANGFRAPGLYTGYEHVLVESGQIIQDAILAGNTEGMRESSIAVADELNKEYVDSKDNVGYTTLTETLTEAETAQLMANILYDSGYGDLALITHTGEKNGVINAQGCGGYLYSGGINDIRILIINANRNMHIVTKEMTGAEIKELLETGKGLYEGEYQAIKGTVEYADKPEELPQEYFEYYWSGVDVTMKDGKVTSMKINNEEMDEEETYTVAFAELDYPRAYFDTVTEWETLVSDAMISYFEKFDSIDAPEVLRK